MYFAECHKIKQFDKKLCILFISIIVLFQFRMKKFVGRVLVLESRRSGLPPGRRAGPPIFPHPNSLNMISPHLIGQLPQKIPFETIKTLLKLE